MIEKRLPGARATVSGFVSGREIVVEVFADTADRFREDRLKLYWRDSDMLSWMIEQLPRDQKELREADVERFLDRLESQWGLKTVQVPVRKRE